MAGCFFIICSTCNSFRYFERAFSFFLKSSIACTSMSSKSITDLLLSIARKSCRLAKAKQMSEDYFKIHRSKKSMKQKLTDKSIRYIIRELKKGKSTKMLSEEINVTQRHVQRLQAEYLKTKTVHIQRPAGRPKSHGHLMRRSRQSLRYTT